MADSLLTDETITDNEPAAMQEIMDKWKDKPQSELLTAKARSDLYIKTLTARFDDLKNDYLQLREQHQTSDQLKDLIDRLEKERAPVTPNDNTRDTNRDNVVPPVVQPQDIEALVAKKMTEHQLKTKQQENFNSVQGKLREQFGEQYQSALKQRSEQLGLTPEFVDDLARNHPTVFFKTFELDAPSRLDVFQTPPRTNQRPTSFAPKVPKRDWAYYQELKKNDPRLYLDPKIAVQMDADAFALGADFGMPED